MWIHHISSVPSAVGEHLHLAGCCQQSCSRCSGMGCFQISVGHLVDNIILPVLGLLFDLFFPVLLLWTFCLHEPSKSCLSGHLAVGTVIPWVALFCYVHIIALGFLCFAVSFFNLLQTFVPLFHDCIVFFMFSIFLWKFFFLSAVLLSSRLSDCSGNWDMRLNVALSLRVVLTELGQDAGTGSTFPFLPRFPCRVCSLCALKLAT